MVHIGLKIKGLVDKEKLDIPYIAEKLGKSRQAVYDMFGKEDLNTSVLRQFSNILRVPLKTFVEEDSDVDGDNGIPYYNELPATAGTGEMAQIEEAPSGYIKLPRVVGKYAFPVVGYSMEPKVYSGDIVVVDNVDRAEPLDPDKIYLIITAHDRMIKHLEIDPSNDEIVWCVSPNYRKFAIAKADIKFIYKVTLIIRTA